MVYDCLEALFLRMWFPAAPLHTALSSSQSHHLTGFEFRGWCVAMRAIVSPTWSHDSKCAPSNLQRMITVLDHIEGEFSDKLRMVLIVLVNILLDD